MERINDLDELSRLVNGQLCRGVRTNNTMSAENCRRELSAGTLYAQPLTAGLLLLRRRESFWLLNYYLPPEAKPFAVPLDGRVVTELPFRPKDAPMEGELLTLFRASGFREQLRRVRLERPAGAVEGVDAGFMFRKGAEADLPAALALMRDCFEPLTGCLPSEAELRADILAGDLICATDRDGALAGLLHAGRGRAAAEIRHLAVRAGLRGRGCARGLIAAWLEGLGGGKTRVWAGADNTAALGAYAASGYRRDGWYSVVLAGDFTFPA